MRMAARREGTFPGPRLRGPAAPRRAPRPPIGPLSLPEADRVPLGQQAGIVRQLAQVGEGVDAAVVAVAPEEAQRVMADVLRLEDVGVRRDGLRVDHAG